MHKDYYVYVLFREFGQPFYVGMGRGDRIDQHEKRCRRLSTHRDHLIAAMLNARLDVPKVKIRERLSKAAAAEIEIALIAAIGREPLGPLINQTSGGDGVHDLSPDVRAIMAEKVRAKLKGTKRPPEVCQRISQTKRAKFGPREPRPARAEPYRHSAEVRRKIADAGRGRPQTEEKSRKISEALTGRKLSEVHRAKISAVQVGRKQDPTHAAARTAKSRDGYMKLTAEQRSAITARGWETRRAKRNESSSSFA